MGMSEQCPKGHPIKSSADRINGYCRRCKADYDREYQLKQKAARDVVRVFEAAGAVFVNDGVPVTPEEVAQQLLKVYGNSIK
jgi:hypothetical protein